MQGLGLVHWDDPEGWYGEGRGRGDSGRETRAKADVSVNIYAHLVAQREGKPVLYSCAIGDETVNGIPYDEIIRTAGEYIRSIGGFEKLAEWGLV